MPILHGVIIRRTRRYAEHPLFLWIEKDATDWDEETAFKRHPGCWPLAEAERILADAVGPLVGAQRGVAELMLPTGAERPVCSSTLSPGGELVLRPWYVTGVFPASPSLPPIMEWLMQDDAVRPVQLAPSLRYVARLARWVWAQIANKRVVPDLDDSDIDFSWKIRSVWRLVGDAEQESALSTFARHMPMALVAEIGWVEERSPGVFATGEDVRRAALRFFTDILVDACVRHVVKLDRVDAEATKRGRIVQRWVTALQKINPCFEASRQALSIFQDALDVWRETGKSMAEAADPDAQLVLQLVPLMEDGDESPLRVPTGWRLDIALRPPGGTEVITAAEVWDETSPSEVQAYRSVLRHALFEASRVFSPLRRVLSEAEPTGCVLSQGEVEYLVTRGFQELHGAGVLLQLPAWLKQTPKAVQPKVVVAPVSEGTLSLGSLISFEWQATVGDASIDEEQFERLVAANLPYVQLNGEWIAVHPEQIRRLFEVHRRTKGRVDAVGDLVAAMWDFENEVKLSFSDEKAAEVFEKLWQACGTPKKWELLPQPTSLQTELLPYQQRGFSWLVFMREFGLGACLADDMGLGKTVQVIALLLHNQASGVAKPSLVVCPLSVVENWRYELTRFAPSLRVYVHHGGERCRGEAFRSTVSDHDVVVTSYGLVLRDSEDFGSVAWDTIVADEAQQIKNPLAKQTRVLKGLEAVHRIALTGTPIENRLTELWSILDFLNPGYLGSLRRFRTEVAAPIEAADDEEMREDLRRRITPFILRRSKADPDIAPDLPEKREMKVFCHLTPEQAALYQGLVDQMMGRIEAADGMKRRGLVLASLTRLKQICNDPALYFKQDRSDPARSGKLQRLLRLAEDIVQAGDKALIFTQYAYMGRLLQRVLVEHIGKEALFLHGGVSRRERDRLIERFQAGDAPFFILSLRAGGVGLNLTRATHVVHFDRWWNPAVENQATDRAYRIGQTEAVSVYKFICRGTLEEHIDRLSAAKQALADEIIEGGDYWLSELSNEELREVFALQYEEVRDAE